MKVEIICGHYSDQTRLVTEVVDIIEAFRILEMRADEYAEEQKFEYVDGFDVDTEEEAEEEGFQEAMDQGYFQISVLDENDVVIKVYEDLKPPFYVGDYE